MRKSFTPFLLLLTSSAFSWSGALGAETVSPAQHPAGGSEAFGSMRASGAGDGATSTPEPGIDTGALLKVDPSVEAIYGNPQAAVSVISYMDFTCPYCRTLRPTLRKLVNRSNGQINWVFRHFPLTDAPDGGLLEARAAECAGQTGGPARFWAFANQLYNLPRRALPDSEQAARMAARGSNTDWDVISQCIRQGDTDERIHKQRVIGVQLGVKATPTLFVVDQASRRYRSIEGAASFATLEREAGLLMKADGE